VSTDRERRVTPSLPRGRTGMSIAEFTSLDDAEAVGVPAAEGVHHAAEAALAGELVGA